MQRRMRGRSLARSLVSAGMALVVTATGLVTSGLVTTGSAAQAAPGGSDPSAKIRPELARQFETRDAADFWIRFTSTADLTRTSAIRDWTARGTAVADALKAAARQSQAKVRAELDAAGLRYEAFWATNAIMVSGAPSTVATRLARHGEVEGLYAPVAYQLPKLDPDAERATTERNTLDAVEWGIANINADDVWDRYGARGQGITVASIDSGVQFDHPALVGSYRGNRGDGTFDHNYNWFRATGSCAIPCDVDGHGTHTMGTLAGLDGANQIGVAPEVKWITANGCCPSNAAVIASGQWMLEPTDLSGQNPDASKRPNIINNSWGSTVASTDPFFDDITRAWEASGIFAVFSNGNLGSRGCQSASTPASRAANYAVGSYDINNTIAASSGRGAGQDGEIKPNLAAPGVSVRSSLPGSGYGVSSGTSMATPHVAGTVALLWSAAPGLVGDIAATRALLDGTAVDQSDAQCGGTTEDNNVYGEGRLDALAVLDAAPIGANGTLAGTVTDAVTRRPIGGVTISLTGRTTRITPTATDGTYAALLPVGDYEATVSAFGYEPRTVRATVTGNATTTLDVRLTAVSRVTVEGTVTDGSGHGWPLYAKVTVEGTSPVHTHTAPATGRYRLSLPAGATYRLRFEPLYPRYETVTKDVVAGSVDVVADASVKARTDSCTEAPGYRFGSDGTFESFEGASAPTGWTVVDHAGTGQGWTFTDERNRTNLTGGFGTFAIVDSDKFGSSGRQDTSLVSPLVDLTTVTAPVIRFNQDLFRNSNEKADVDLSVDGGSTWTNVLRQTNGVRGPRVTEIPIPQAAGQAQVRVRFHYYDAVWDWWWQVDSVLIGSTVTCEPVDGGLVVGHVRDRNTGGPVNGASVTSNDRPAEKTVTTATPDDTGLADGFYWLFSSATGAHPFTVKFRDHVDQTGSVDVRAHRTTSADFSLAAGRLEVRPAALGGTVRMPDGKITRTFTVTNTGTAPANVGFVEQDGGVRPRSGPGASATSGPQDQPWTGIADTPANVMDNRVVRLGGKIYSIGGQDEGVHTARSFVYDPDTRAWSDIAPLPAARSGMTVAAIDGKIIAAGGLGAGGLTKNTWSYDPGTDSWTEKAAGPVATAMGGQAVLDGKLYSVGGCAVNGCGGRTSRVLRYDPFVDAWETLPDYPRPVAWLACGGIDGILYCSGGNEGFLFRRSAFAFDPKAGTWTPIADAPIEHWGSVYAVANGKLMVVGGSQTPAGGITNAGFAYDPKTNTWSALPNANVAVYRGGAACGFVKVGGARSGFTALRTAELLPGFEECSESSDDVGWIEVDRTGATLAPGQSITVTVTMSANVTRPGTYTGLVAVRENTPYPVSPVRLTLEIDAPAAPTGSGEPISGPTGSGEPISGPTP